MSSAEIRWSSSHPTRWLAGAAREIEATLDRELEPVRSTLESQPPEPAPHPEAVVTRHVREPLARSSSAGPPEAAKEDRSASEG